MSLLPLAGRNSQLHRRMIAPTVWVRARCELPCGVPVPAQAKIEAQSVKACMEKYHGSGENGAGGTKGSTDVAVADQLLAKIDEIDAIFKENKRG